MYASTQVVSRMRDQRIVLARQHDRERIEAVDALGDLPVDRVDDLRTGGEEHLVAVVGGRVVRRRHHHAGRGVEPGDRPGQHRRRLHAGMDHRPDAERGQHTGGVEGEDVALAAGVVGDDHATLRGVRDRPGLFAVEQPLAEPGGGLADHEPVHPHRTGADRGAQPGRAELQAAGEAFGAARRRRRVRRVRSGRRARRAMSSGPVRSASQRSCGSDSEIVSHR